MKKTRVIILFGGRSAEHEISLLSARNVLSALDRTRFEPVLVGIDKAGRWHRESERTLEAAAGDPRGVMLDASAPAVGMEDALVARAPGGALDADVNMGTLKGSPNPPAMVRGEQSSPAPHADSDAVVFPVLHGTFGEDGTVQGAMELAGIAYVGAGVLGSAIGMDKDVAKRLLRDAGIPVVDFGVVTAGAFRRDPAAALRALPDLGYPRYVKPANAGSSVGVSRAAGPGDLERAVRAALAFEHLGVEREGGTDRARSNARCSATTTRKRRSRARSSSTTRTASIRTTRSTSIPTAPAGRSRPICRPR